MTQGVQIPIQTVANNTVTVTFKDAALTLKVTPQITASNTVIMSIYARERGRPTTAGQVNGIPPIDTQRAITQVLVNDGGDDGDRRHHEDARKRPRRTACRASRGSRCSAGCSSGTRRRRARELLIFITPRIRR